MLGRPPLLAHPRRLGRRPCALGAAHRRASSEGARALHAPAVLRGTALRLCRSGAVSRLEDRGVRRFMARIAWGAGGRKPWNVHPLDTRGCPVRADPHSVFRRHELYLFLLFWSAALIAPTTAPAWPAIKPPTMARFTTLAFPVPGLVISIAPDWMRARSCSALSSLASL